MVTVTFPDLFSTRVRRLGLGLLLLAVPACGLSDYEALMSEAQKREQHFREEQLYLDGPLKMPKQKVQRPTDKEPHEKEVAKMFLRPPLGIESKPKLEQWNGLMWQYPAGSRGSDFSSVQLAFAEDEKGFAEKVVNSYQTTEQPRQEERRFPLSGQDAPMIVDSWEFGNAQVGYSVNILRSSRPIAIVYIYNKARLEIVRKTIDLSLQTLAVDQQADVAQQHYNQKSPWKLTGKRGS